MWTDVAEAFSKAFALMGEGNPLFGEIVRTTLVMCLQSSVYSMLIGVPIGVLVAIGSFPGKKIVVTVMRTLMGLPAVAVGIFVYLLFSGTGPFGGLGLMYSVELMVIAQVILITPVVAGMTESAVSPAYEGMRETVKGLNLNKGKAMLLAVNECKYQMIAVYLFAFGRSIAEAVLKELPGVEVDLIGTNAIATANMLKSGAKNAATGENPVVVMAPRADVIIGPVGIAVADSMMGEVTPKMAVAVGQSRAKKILIPMNRCDIMIAGVGELPLSEMVRRVIAMLKGEPNNFCAVC